MSTGRESSSSPSIIDVDNVDWVRARLPNDWVEPVPMDAALYLEARFADVYEAESFDEPASPDNHHHEKSSVNISHKKSASIESSPFFLRCHIGDIPSSGFADTEETIMILNKTAASRISVDSLVEQLGSHDNRASTRNPDGLTDLQAVVKQGKNLEQLEA
ncbi:hypothetical protein RUND412_011537 [Rhizina undulata]